MRLYKTNGNHMKKNSFRLSLFLSLCLPFYAMADYNENDLEFDYYYNCENYSGLDEQTCCKNRGVWLPEAPELFKPLKADPRQITSSVGWRFNDKIFNKNVVAVSYADSVPVYRWFDIVFCGAQMQLDIEGACWAIFEPTLESSPLVNADYYCGAALTGAYNEWSFRFRIYHISSHLGDEFLLNMQNEKGDRFKRLNPSAEYIEFHLAYDWRHTIRMYGGIGYIPLDDRTFPTGKKPYFELGFEQYFHFWNFYNRCNRVCGRPFQALHTRYDGMNNYNIDLTYVAGYEFNKCIGLARALRFFGEYHSGFSVEGQFAKRRTHYYSIRMTYGY